MLKRAAIYCRISNDPEGRRLGVQRQEEDARAIAKTRGYEVTDLYVENDTGASTRSKKPRPKFDHMLTLARAGQYDAVIAYSSSRLTRRPKENETLIELYEKHGVLIHYANTNDNDLSTARGRRRARDDAARDAEEVEELAERVERTAKQRAEEGRPNGGTRPYGWSEKDRRKLDKREHRILVEMADRALAGESLRSIAADLNRRHIKTAKGALWSPTAIKGILTNARLVGDRIHNKMNVGVGDWEPALPRDTYDQLRSLLTDESRRIAMSNKVRNLLTGIALCGECGARMSAKTQMRTNQTKVDRYLCAVCNLYRTKEPIDEYVQGAVIEYLRTAGEEPDEGIDPKLLKQIEKTREKIRATQARFAAVDDMTPDDLLEALRPLKDRLRSEESLVRRRERSSIVAAAMGPDAEAKWEGYELGTKRLIITELLEVRIMRTVRGKRGFDPNSVKLRVR
jgi:site-specific DNA recombinase